MCSNSFENEYGASVSQVVEYEILPNQKPEIVKPISDFYFGVLSQETSLPLIDYFKDEGAKLIRFI